MPVGGDYEKSWPPLIRSLFYLFVLLWSFQGVGIICDEFMAAIEKITSSKCSKWITNPAGQKVEVRVTVWNETLANLSLMAPCSSAPEILLSTVELCSNRFFSGSLGPQTVVGSASFNLFCISSVCISALAPGEVRRIEKYPVFCFTCAASVLAYVWMLVVLAGITPDRVDLAEGVITLLLFFVFLGIAFMLDKYFSTSSVDPDVAEDSSCPCRLPPKNSLLYPNLKSRYSATQQFCAAFSSVPARAGDAGVRAMMKTQGNKPSCEMRNSKNEAKGEVWTPCVPVASDILLPSSLQWKAEKLTVAGQILRLSTGGKKQPSIFTYGFLESEVVCNEGDGFASLQIAALNGPHAAPVRVKYRTRNGMAKAGKRYHQRSGVLHFVAEEEKQELRIPLMMARGPPEEFYVELTEIKGDGAEGKKNPPILGQSVRCQGLRLACSAQRLCQAEKTRMACHGLTLDSRRMQHLAAVPSGMLSFAQDRLLDVESTQDARALSDIRSEAKSEVKSEARSEARSDARSDVQQATSKLSSVQAVEAFFCNGSPEEQAQATAFDWLMHCLALTWKIAFMIVPPPSLLGAYPAFFCSLLGIGLVTVVINDAASLLGCSVGMADDLTAITLVALGTSLPDTMASRTAAKSDDTADNSIGNITGSNTVNVLLGMGISWTIGAAYWAHNGVTDDPWRTARAAALTQRVSAG
ncbi:SLC8A2 [Symbiodinium natans]|uniref:SLC8A2 protein n=1 Tax=Symbiodinium natans TaxID=878477 RepID=A0A812JT74_9DINO|nr:SLC8A2 [Symbiodinium natans]